MIIGNESESEMTITACCVAMSHHIDDCNDLNQPTHQEEDGGDTHKVGFQIPDCKVTILIHCISSLSKRFRMTMIHFYDLGHAHEIRSCFRMILELWIIYIYILSSMHHHFLNGSGWQWFILIIWAMHMKFGQEWYWSFDFGKNKTVW